MVRLGSGLALRHWPKYFRRECRNARPDPSRSGQTTSEYVVVLAILTLIGIYLMHTMIGQDWRTGKDTRDGAIFSAGGSAADKIAQDP